MRSFMVLVGCLLIGAATAVQAVTKPHVLAFGKWTTVKLLTGAAEDKAVDLKMRPLFVDGRQREYTFGLPHEVTERIFVVRRLIRVNDALPDESVTHWYWQSGGWLVVDRSNGHIATANLPEYDPENSAVSWFRDYVAYFAISDDGKKFSAVVRQLGRRKPILKKPIDALVMSEAGPEFAAPVWQRQPTRVTFVVKDQKFVYTVHGHVVEIENDDPSDDSE